MRITDNEADSKGSDGHKFKGRNARRVRHDHRFEFYLASSQMLLDEIRDQYNVALNTVNSLIQRSGIIMAFNSVFLIELFNLQSTGNSLWTITVISTFISMFLGLIIVVEGRLMSVGTKIDMVIQTYNAGSYEGLTPEISNGKLEALQESMRITKLTSNLVMMQTTFLLVSVVGLVIMEMWK